MKAADPGMSSTNTSPLPAAVPRVGVCGSAAGTHTTPRPTTRDEWTSSSANPFRPTFQRPMSLRGLHAHDGRVKRCCKCVTRPPGDLRLARGHRGDDRTVGSVARAGASGPPASLPESSGMTAAGARPASDQLREDGQALPSGGGRLAFFGPAAPRATGLRLGGAVARPACSACPRRRVLASRCDEANAVALVLGGLSQRAGGDSRRRQATHRYV